MANLIPLEFTTTAMPRPEILHRTYQSFKKNLLGVDWARSRLYINIDPFPGMDLASAAHTRARTRTLMDVMEHFPNVCAMFPSDPDFASAVKWCWAMPQGEFFFHLEDDWELQRPVDIQELLQPLGADWASQGSLACASIRVYGFQTGDRRICLSPGLFRTSRAKALAARLTPGMNPEKQLRPTDPVQNPNGDRHQGLGGVQIPTKPYGPTEPSALVDIGRDWLANSNYRKQRGGHPLWAGWEVAK